MMRNLQMAWKSFDFSKQICFSKNYEKMFYFAY